MPAGSSKASGRTGAEHTPSRAILLTDQLGIRKCGLGSVRVRIVFWRRGGLRCRGAAALRARALFASVAPLVQADDDLLDLEAHGFQLALPIAGDHVAALGNSIDEPIATRAAARRFRRGHGVELEALVEVWRSGGRWRWGGQAPSVYRSCGRRAAPRRPRRPDRRGFLVAFGRRPRPARAAALGCRASHRGPARPSGTRLAAALRTAGAGSGAGRLRRGLLLAPALARRTGAGVATAGIVLGFVHGKSPSRVGFEVRAQSTAASKPRLERKGYSARPKYPAKTAASRTCGGSCA